MNGNPVLPALDRDMSIASDEQLLRVVGLIDKLDRRGPVDRLLEPVRGRLALLRPPRPITLGRVLILPLEDLLVAADEAWPGRRCLSRAHLAWLVARVTAALPTATADRLRASAEGHSMLAGNVVRELGATLWPAAAETAGSWLADDGLAADLRAQLASVAPLLDLAPALVPLLWQLPPRPMGALPRSGADVLLQAVRLAVPKGEAAVQSVLELLLVRSASPLVVLEPLRAAELGTGARQRDAMLAQLVRRRIGDMRATASKLAAAGAVPGRAGAAALLRLATDLDVLEAKWPASREDRATLGEIRGTASAFVGAGIDNAVRHEILGQLEGLVQPDAVSDESVERLEEAARHTRRLGIAGARLGLAPNPDELLGRFLPTVADAVRRPGKGGTARAGLLDQVRIVEILFGPDAAIRLYDEVRGGRAAAAPAR